MKNLLLISKDENLKNELSDLDLFNVRTLDELKCLEEIDILIVSDRLIDYNDFIAQYNLYKHIPKILFMTSNDDEFNLTNMKVVLKTKGIVYIPPKLTTKQIIQRIVENEVALDMIGNNIVAIFGIDSKVGTTMISQSIAETMASLTDKRVFLGFLNGSPSDEYVNVSEESLGLDDIKIKIVNNILSSNELESACIRKDNLFILQGVRNVNERRFYHPSDIENLIKCAAKTFDIVIIDAGNDLDMGMTIGALNSTNIRYLVTTQQESAIGKFKKILSPTFTALDFEMKDFLLIINKFMDIPSIYSASQLATIYKASLADIVPFVEYGWQAEKDKKTLLNYDSEGYKEKIRDISKLLSEQINIKLKEDIPIKSKGWFKRIFTA